MGAGKHILRNHLGHEPWLPRPAAHPHAHPISPLTHPPSSQLLLPMLWFPTFFWEQLLWSDCFLLSIASPGFPCPPVSCPHRTLSHRLPVVNNISALSRMLQSLPGLSSTDLTHFQTQRTTGLSAFPSLPCFQDFNRLKYNTESLLCAVWGAKWIHFLLAKTENRNYQVQWELHFRRSSH